MKASPLVLLAALLASCSSYYVRSGGDGTMRVRPPRVSLESLPMDTYGTFDLTVIGRDTMNGLRWLPGIGSRLEIEVTDVADFAASPDEGGTFTLRYVLRGAELPEGETGLPADDGVLRLFFDEHPTVDVWVEVQR